MYAWYYKARWYIGIAALFCLAISVMKYSKWLDHRFFGRPKQPRTVAQQPLQTGNQQASPVTQSVTSTHGAATPPADVVTQLVQAKSLLEDASTNATEALQLLLTWQSDVEPLRDQVVAEPAGLASDGESGEADDPSKLFDRLSYVMRRERTSAESLRDAATRIESLQLKVDGLLNQARPDAPSPIEIAEISQLHATCKQAKENWARDVEQALAIKHLIETRTGSSAKPAAPTTIGRKVKDADAKAALADLDKQIVREEEAEALRLAREAELKKQRRQREEREAELLAKATSSEVKALLAPFLEPRTIQPSLSGTFSIKWIRTFEKRPMSLGKLISIGALDDSVLGLKKLALVGGNRKLPEPKWSVESQPNNWSSEDEDRLKQAQQMLRDYGPTLVRAKLLSE